MKKLIALSIVSTLLLSSCGSSTETTQTAEGKTPFSVETKTVSDFGKEYTKEKSGRLVGSSTISLASQGIGRVVSIAVKEGASVKKGQTLVTLSDTTANYGLRRDQAENAVKNQDATIASTKLSLDKAVTDSENALAKAKSAYESAKNDATKQIEKAERDAKKAVVSSTGSDAQIALEKAQMDFENLKKSNTTTISNYQATYTLTVSDLKKLVETIRYDSDKILGISTENRSANDSFEIYLGARDASYKTTAENKWDNLNKTIAFLDSKKDLAVDESNLLTELGLLSDSYSKTREFLLAMGTMLENSIASQTLPQTQIDAYVATFNGYKSSLSGLESGFISFKSGANTFLSNYKNNEASAATALETQKKSLANSEFDSSISLDRTKISLTNSVEQSRLAYESAESAYQNAIDNRTITLQKLEVSRKDALLSLESADKDVAKLAITSPIDATVTHVIASVGQDVSAGTVVVEIASTNPEIVFDLDADSVALLSIGSEQAVKYDGQSYTGTVVGISKIASDSLLYTARLSLKGSPKYLGGVATISLAFDGSHLMLPNKMIRVISESEGEVTTLSGSTQLVNVPVKLGQSIGDHVEILTKLDSSAVLVTSDVSNFDERKNTLEIHN